MSAYLAADIDATVMTSNAEMRTAIRGDSPDSRCGASRSAGQTRIQATGKMNGGGERVELYAEEGDINITQQVGNPISVVRP